MLRHDDLVTERSAPPPPLIFPLRALHRCVPIAGTHRRARKKRGGWKDHAKRNKKKESRKTARRAYQTFREKFDLFGCASLIFSRYNCVREVINQETGKKNDSSCVVGLKK